VTGISYQTFRDLAALHNVTEGQGLTHTQRMQMALNTLRAAARDGLEINVAATARLYGLSAKTLSKARNVDMLRERLGPGGDIPVPLLDRLSDKVLEALNPGLVYPLSVQQLAIGLAGLKRVPTAKELTSIVSEMRALSDRRKRDEFVTSYLAGLAQSSQAPGGGKLTGFMAQTGGKRPVLSLADKLRKAATAFMTTLKQLLPADKDPHGVLDETPRLELAEVLHEVRNLTQDAERRLL
jgi:hypothetical protein